MGKSPTETLLGKRSSSGTAGPTAAGSAGPGSTNAGTRATRHTSHSDDPASIGEILLLVLVALALMVAVIAVTALLAPAILVSMLVNGTLETVAGLEIRLFGWVLGLAYGYLLVAWILQALDGVIIPRRRELLEQGIESVYGDRLRRLTEKSNGLTMRASAAVLAVLAVAWVLQIIAVFTISESDILQTAPVGLLGAALGLPVLAWGTYKVMWTRRGLGFPTTFRWTGHLRLRLTRRLRRRFGGNADAPAETDTGD